VQREIVRILDTFTELIAELIAELTARKRQYECYRDKLLSFNIQMGPSSKEQEPKTQTQSYFAGYVPYKPLAEVLTIKNGKDYKKFSQGSVPVYGSGGIIAHIDQYVYDKPSVLIPRKGSLNKLYYVDFPFWTVDTIFYTEINSIIVQPKFVFYFLQAQHLERLNTAGGVPSLTQAMLNKLLIPVPSLSEQSRIVAILDRFDALCNDLSSGLPAEIAARQKQYEYYRDKLLTFKEKSA
jgi:type I restriction enzyme S subunit